MKIHFLLFFSFILSVIGCHTNNVSVDTSLVDTTSLWVGPSMYQIPKEDGIHGAAIWYGYQLVKNTSQYFGPNGSIAKTTNGMSCSNCHLDAGTKPLGLNFGSVYSTYPKFRERSGAIETIYKRVNDCFERSLNGKALDTNSKEMRSIYAYIQWLGEGVKKGVKVKGSGYENLTFMTEASDPIKGNEIYNIKCASCHQLNGQGVLDANKINYVYPPLWGDHSYNDGAGLHQNSKLAGFIKNNMPQPTDHRHPILNNEEAWHLAAFINNQPRPHKDVSEDWPNLSKKPFDYPVGPYIDSFSEHQHQFGPYQPIVDFYKRSFK